MNKGWQISFPDNQLQIRFKTKELSIALKINWIEHQDTYTIYKVNWPHDQFLSKAANKQELYSELKELINKEAFVKIRKALRDESQKQFKIANQYLLQLPYELEPQERALLLALQACPGFIDRFDYFDEFSTDLIMEWFMDMYSWAEEFDKSCTSHWADLYVMYDYYLLKETEEMYNQSVKRLLNGE